MTRAAAQDQRRLLELQKLDTRLARLAHERRTLPVLAELTRLDIAARDTEAARVRAATRIGDLKRDLARVEDDVEQIRQRAARYQARIDGAGASARDVQAMQQEIALLAHRTSALEDQELEQMETVEAAQADLGAIEEQSRATAEEIRARSEERDAEWRRVDADIASVRAQRDELAASLPADLVALYDEVRAQTGGIGAVALYGSRTEGVGIELPLTELDAIRALPPDAVATSEEHGYILVRMT